MRWVLWDTVLISLCFRALILLCLLDPFLKFKTKLDSKKATSPFESPLVVSSLSKVQEELKR